MAQKKTYIYRMQIGKAGQVKLERFLWARNSTVAKDFCKEVYRAEKYDLYKPIKVGQSRHLRETGFIPDDEVAHMKNAGATRSEYYSESNMGLPWVSQNSGGQPGAVANIPEQGTESVQPAGE